VLNGLWVSFFVLAAGAALGKLALGDGGDSLAQVVQGMFDGAKTGFELSLGLAGVLCFWLGLMKVGERAGALDGLSRLVSPVMRRIFPGVPAGHPVLGDLTMNFAANMLGLDNAATPVGLRAMKQLQALNPRPDEASDAQIMFLVLNTSGLTLIPMTVMMYRAQLGAANPADIFLPTLLATTLASLAGFLIVAFMQRMRLRDPVLLAVIGGGVLGVSGLLFGLSRMPPAAVERVSQAVGHGVLLAVVVGFLVAGWRRKLAVFDVFVEGAKEGFGVAVGLIPVLVAMLVGVAAFRASGALGMFVDGMSVALGALGLETGWLPALPTALMKPLSGSGARALMLDTMHASGPDAWISKLVCVIQGSTDTTLYILAVYFGAVNIRRARHALPCGLFADAVGIVSAVLLTYLFWGAP
jgi:spore maturation protein SpmA